jgi:hypothetical protein
MIKLLLAVGFIGLILYVLLQIEEFEEVQKESKYDNSKSVSSLI